MLRIYRLIEETSKKKLVEQVECKASSSELVLSGPVQLMAGYYLVEADETDLMNLMLMLPERREKRGTIIRRIPLPTYERLTLEEREGYFEEGDPGYIDWHNRPKSSNNIFIYESTGRKLPGTYFPVFHDGKWTAAIVCPECGTGSTMFNHTIADDGTVHASIQCPNCSYHVWGRLDDWQAAKAQWGG